MHLRAHEGALFLQKCLRRIRNEGGALIFDPSETLFCIQSYGCFGSWSSVTTPARYSRIATISSVVSASFEVS